MTPSKVGGIERLKLAVDHLLGAVVAALMAALVVDVLWQVFTRFVMRNPSSFTDELARYLLVWVGLLGAAYCAGQKLHLAIDLFPSRLTGGARHLVEIAIQGTVLVFALAVMVVGGARLVGLTLLLGQTSAALQLPLGAVYTVLPLSGVLIAFYAVVFILEHVRALREGEPLPEPVLSDIPHDVATTTAYE